MPKGQSLALILAMPVGLLFFAGKATVQVVILADPDGHEICFVGEEGFRELSAMDPEAPRLLEEALAADRSAEWLARRAAVEAQVAAEKARA